VIHAFTHSFLIFSLFLHSLPSLPPALNKNGKEDFKFFFDGKFFRQGFSKVSVID
jgi:hypothetical protein